MHRSHALRSFHAVLPCNFLAIAVPLHAQNLWPIFLTHLMEVLHSGNSAIRAAGLEALDRTLTGQAGQTAGQSQWQ